MAALWDSWRAPDGKLLDSGSIITTGANEVVTPIHDRMPAILTVDEAKDWMSGPFDADHLKSLLRPIDESLLQAYNGAGAQTVEMRRPPNNKITQATFEF
jgi:putative SOS response-associated peptidase YedK